MRNLVLKFARAIKKNPDFRIDDRMPTTAILAMLWTTGLAFLRGLWRRPWLGGARGMLFIGKHVTIRNPRLVSVGRSFVAEDYSEIQGLSAEGVRIGNNVTMARYAMIRPSGYYGGEIGVGFQIGDGSNIGAFAYMGAAGGIRIGRNVMMGPPRQHPRRAAQLRPHRRPDEVAGNRAQGNHHRRRRLAGGELLYSGRRHGGRGRDHRDRRSRHEGCAAVRHRGRRSGQGHPNARRG